MLTLNRIFQKLELTAGTFIVAGMLVLISISIFLRYVASHPLMWADELSCFGLIGITFLAIPYLFSRNDHVALTLLQTRMSPKIKNITLICINSLIMLCFIILYPSCLRCIQFLTPSPALRLNLAYIYILLPISYALMIFHGTCNIICILRGTNFTGEVK